MTSSKNSVAVIGAGISGLSAAYALQKDGFSVTVFEKKQEAGGVMRTERPGGWLLELGPNTLQVKSDRLRILFDDLQLTDSIQEANPIAKKRFIVKNGRPVPIPLSLQQAITSKLFSMKAKLRLLKEPFISAGESADESIASFIRRRLGSEPLDYAVNPFVSGVYAGDPEELSMKHTFSSLFEMEQQHGSLIKGVFARRNSSKSNPSLISFADGLQTLPRTIASTLGKNLHLKHSVNSIKRKNNSWKLSGERQLDQNFEFSFDAVVLTTPPYKWPTLLDISSIRQELQMLQQIPYVPLHVLHLGFDRNQIDHPLDGFGLLVPKVEKRNILGTLFSSTLFPGRAPSGRVLLSCFLGGARQPELAGANTENLIKLAMDDLSCLLDIKGDPVFHKHTFWKRAIPQYVTGYVNYLSAMQNLEEKAPGLFLLGNFRGGVSVPDRLKEGLEIPAKITMFLQQSSS